MTQQHGIQSKQGANCRITLICTFMGLPKSMRLGTCRSHFVCRRLAPNGIRYLKLQSLYIYILEVCDIQLVKCGCYDSSSFSTHFFVTLGSRNLFASHGMVNLSSQVVMAALPRFSFCFRQCQHTLRVDCFVPQTLRLPLFVFDLCQNWNLKQHEHKNMGMTLLELSHAQEGRLA